MFGTSPPNWTPTTPLPPALDAFTASLFGVYGVVKLLSNYFGNCLRVRRSSDNAEQDIGFGLDGALNSAAMLTFVGANNNGFVTKWYDQSGTANDLSTATVAWQPVIVMKGTYLGGVRGDGIDDILQSALAFPAVTGMATFMRGKWATNFTTQKLYQLGDRPTVFVSTLAYWHKMNNSLASGGNGSTAYTRNDFGLANQVLDDAAKVYACSWDKTQGAAVNQLKGYIDGAQLASSAVAGGAPTTNPFSAAGISLFRQPTQNANSIDDGAWPANVTMTCFVIYSTTKVADIAGISAALKAVPVLALPALSWYTRQKYDSPDSMVKLTEPSGPFVDTGGNARAVTITGAGTIGRGVAPVYSNLDGGASFDRAQQTCLFIAHPFGAPSYGAPWTIALEGIRFPSLAVDQCILGGGTTAALWGVQVIVRTTGAIDFYIVTTNGGDFMHTTSAPAGTIVAGTKYVMHLVWDRGSYYQNGGRCYIYVNGVRVGTMGSVATNYAIRNNNTNFMLGRYAAGASVAEFGTFELDEYALYAYVLPEVVMEEHWRLAGV